MPHFAPVPEIAVVQERSGPLVHLWDMLVVVPDAVTQMPELGEVERHLEAAGNQGHHTRNSLVLLVPKPRV